MSTITLKTLQNTVFKLSTADSSALSGGEKIEVAKDTIFEVHSHLPASNNHVKVALKNAALGSAGRNTWYCFNGHILISGNESANNPNDVPAQNVATRAEGNIVLPDGSKVSFNTPIITAGHFTWGEVMQGDMRRIPPNRLVLNNILRVADVMEEVRSFFGDRSISVNSWHRPPKINRAVGGSSQSRHIAGDALDFNVKGISPHDVRARLDSWWGSRGGLASADTFTHLDCRGYRARWRY